ncbi:MAG: glycosyltransferase family 9 protein [Bacteroidia bacterium]
MVLTLPMAGAIKKHFPSCGVIFLGRSYTKDVIALSEHVDEFLNFDEIEKLSLADQINFFKKSNADIIVHVFPKKEIASLAKKSGIRLRVGTTNRLYHWFTCNRLIKLSRKNSLLHESQLNFKLLDFLNIDTGVSLNDISNYYGFTRIPKLESTYTSLLDKNKLNVILHPKSKGSAKEWGLDNFSKLINLLPAEKYNVFISGTADDGKLMQDFLNSFPQAINLTGKLSLQQFIALIAQSDALVAASTGPLHIAAALGKKAIGLFSPKRPIHPGRWMPVGKNAHYLVFDKNCEKCSNKQDCNCISEISPQQIVDLLGKNERV